PADRVGRVVRGQRQEADVLLRARLAAQVPEGGEVLDALGVEGARGVDVPGEEREVAEVDERGGERTGRARRPRLAGGAGEAQPRGVEVALLAREDPEHVQRL